MSPHLQYDTLEPHPGISNIGVAFEVFITQPAIFGMFDYVMLLAYFGTKRDDINGTIVSTPHQRSTGVIIFTYSFNLTVDLLIYVSKYDQYFVLFFKPKYRNAKGGSSL